MTHTENGSQPTQANQTDQFKMPSSDDFNDPPMGIVLQWHLAQCPYCVVPTRPMPFGSAYKNQFCKEYAEIIQEYADYEGHYAMRGNP